MKTWGSTCKHVAFCSTDPVTKKHEIELYDVPCMFYLINLDVKLRLVPHEVEALRELELGDVEVAKPGMDVFLYKTNALLNLKITKLKCQLLFIWEVVLRIKTTCSAISKRFP